jgi:leader peptidase (prepilin peptidase)/N-methyltransferase
MGLAAVVLTGVLTGSLACLLTPWMRRVAATESRWLRSGGQVVLATGLGIGAAAIARGWVELLAYAVLALACGLLVVVDLAVHRLPDVIVGPTFLVLLVLLTLAAATDGTWAALGRAALAAACVAAGYLILTLISPSALGLGDLKLATLLGAFLGWQGWAQVAVGSAAAFVINGIVVSLLLLTRRARLSSAVAFGPSLVLGAVVGAGGRLW